MCVKTAPMESYRLLPTLAHICRLGVWPGGTPLEHGLWSQILCICGGGWYEGSHGTHVRGGQKDLQDEPKCVFSRSPKKPWYAGFPANKKIFVAVLSSETAKRSPFFALVFYVHETVQGMTRSPLFFCRPRNPSKWPKHPPPKKTRCLKKRGFGQPNGPAV